MNSGEKLYVPVKVKDGCLRYVADKTSEILSQNVRLESIFQKYNEDYNTIAKERFSVKTLQVMKQNHKPIFSSITKAGIIKSPYCSSNGAKMSAKDSAHTPLKRSRISMNTERKRLSFDEPKEDSTALPHEITQICDDSELKVTTPSKSNSPNRFSDTEKEAEIQIERSQPLLNYGGEAGISDSPNTCKQERYNLYGKPETITSHSVYEQEIAHSFDETSDKLKSSVIIPEEKSTTLSSESIKDLKDRNVEISPSFFSSNREDKASRSSDAHALGIFSLQETIESIISLAIQDADKPCLTTRKPDKYQMIRSNPNQIKRHLKNLTLDISEDKPLEISSCFSSEENSKDSYKPKTKNQVSLNSVENPEVTLSQSVSVNKQLKRFEISPSLSIEHKDTVCITNQTPDHSKSMFLNEQTCLINEQTCLINEQTCLINEQTSLHSIKGNKRKSIDYSEDVTNTCLGSEDQKSVVPSKISKLNDGIAEDHIMTIDKTDYSFKDTLNYAGPSFLNDKVSFSFVEESAAIKKSPKYFNNSAMDKKTFNLSMDRMDTSVSTDDSATNDKDFFDSTDSGMNNKTSLILIDKSTGKENISLNTVGNSAVDEKKSLNDVVDSVLNEKIFFDPVYNSNTDEKLSPNFDKDSFNSVDDSSGDNKDSLKPSKDKVNMDETLHKNSDMDSRKFDDSIDDSKKEIFYSAHNQISKMLTCSSLTPSKEDQKKPLENISSLKSDLIEITSLQAAQYSTNLEQNLSPSVKRSFDSSSLKVISKRSDIDEANFARKISLTENLKEAVTPSKDLFSSLMSPKPDMINLNKVDEFCETVIQSKKRLCYYRGIFFDDKCNLQFISFYLKQITAIIEIIPDSAYRAGIVETVQVLEDKAWKLWDKATSWESEIEKDIVVWDDCYKKAYEIQQEMVQICLHKPNNLTEKNFQRWETCLRSINEKSNNMILLRDIKRPTILRFGHELEHVIQLLIRCLFDLGLIKPSSN